MMWFAILLAATPLPTTCTQAVIDLKMRPPAYGEKERAEYVWNFFLEKCEAQMGGPGATFSSEEVDEISKVIQQEGR
jgi:hypothetical protein